MKRLVMAFLLLCMCVGFFGCSGASEQSVATTQPELTEDGLTYSEMLEIAEKVDLKDIYEDVAKNYLKADNSYSGRCYRIGMAVSDIFDGYVDTVGFQTSTSSVISSEVYFADINDLFNITENNTYDIVGEITAIEQNKVVFENAYLVDANNYNFTLDGIYYSQTGSIDPSKYGITVEQSLERNPGRREENMSDDDYVDLFVFATLHAFAEDGANLYLPSLQHKNLSGNELDLRLKVGDDFYNTIYHANDYEMRISKFFDGYKDGYSSFTEDKILEAGSGKCAEISGLFSVKYGVYKEVVANNAEIVLDWGGRYTITFSGQDIVKIGSVSQIADILNNKA